jgi:hypothetical protein
VTTVTLSLISHTNAGKTTLARTLLRRDIGEVRDEPHVTTISEAHTLIETGSARLLLWDTPGFGDSVRLLKRLRHEADPIGWFLHQVWDRVVNRALWCSQEAVRNVREEADVVLYLVNAAEEPGTAAYVEPELELLSWMDRPVLVLLNQVGPDGGGALLERWRRHLDTVEVVSDVVSLDAFSRAWVEESVLLHRVIDLLEGDKRAAMDRLVAAWNMRNLRVFEQSIDAMAHFVAEVATDRDPIGTDARPGSRMLGAIRDLTQLSGIDRQRAMRALFDRLQAATGRLMDRLIHLHELSGESRMRVEQRLEDFAVSGSREINATTGAVAGGLVSGALSGLGADILTGGLTFGGGAVLGALLGAVGGYALGGAYRLAIGRDPAVQWQPAALDRLTGEAVLRYLTVAHHGRGRGHFSDLDHPAQWRGDVDARIAAHRDRLHAVWRQAARSSAAAGEVADDLRPVLGELMRGLLRERFPDAAVLRDDAYM